MGESASARTERELAGLRATIDRDVDALIARVRGDIDPRNLVRRQPLAVAGSLGSIALAATLGVLRRTRRQKAVEGTMDAVIEQLGGRLDMLKGGARKTFRKQLRKELAEVERTGPKEAVYGAVTGALTALATTMARRFGQRLLGDERTEREAER